MVTPPTESHTFAPDKYDYLHQVPEECDISTFLAYSIADESMRSHNSILGPIMAIGKMVEAMTNQIRTLTSDVASLRAEVKTLRSPLPAQPPQQQQSNKGKGKQTYAAAAASANNVPTPAPKNKKEKPAPLYRPQYNKKSREVLIDLLAPLPAHITELQILTTVNRAVHPQKFAQAR
ncbi:hypothetical protein Q9L58_010591 [Maublancomyces gigas]|uniref:Uncharacterized protein n=1 Tax=Discina gigas TaxID=1032678 RepID=A0ABR3G3N3_9PEZI